MSVSCSNIQLCVWIFRLYMLYNHWALKVLLYFFMLVNLSLAIFEDPAVYPLPIWVRLQLPHRDTVLFFNVQAKGAERNKRFVSSAKCPNNRKCFLKNSEMQTVLELIYLKYLSLCHAD